MDDGGTLRALTDGYGNYLGAASCYKFRCDRRGCRSRTGIRARLLVRREGDHAFESGGRRERRADQSRVIVQGVFAEDSVRLVDRDGDPVDFELNAGALSGCPGRH